MNIYYVHDLVEERVSELISQEREEDIVLLLKMFSEAQDLVNKVIPFLFPNDENIFSVLILRMEAREDLLYKFMEPYLEDVAIKNAIKIPIYWN